MAPVTLGSGPCPIAMPCRADPPQPPRRAAAMFGAETRRSIRFTTAMSVAARRYQGKDPATIRREALAVASKAISRNVGDRREQEIYMTEIRRLIDAALK